jgi:hypothetical protein
MTNTVAVFGGQVFGFHKRESIEWLGKSTVILCMRQKSSKDAQQLPDRPS